jgi:chemotaxis protein methyltransferase CheR
MQPWEVLGERLGRWTGLDLTRGGREDALERVLGERLKMVGASSADAYVASLKRPDDPEVLWLVNALTIGHTWFFRDGEQTAAVSQLLKEESSRPVRVWVAACATGEEAYTVAMLAESLGVPIEILATDINSKALDRARVGEYSAWSTREVPRELSSMLEPTSGGRVRVSRSVRAHVRFEQHNLMDPTPAPRTGAGWHVISCRNVLIYFRPADISTTIQRLAGALAVGGYLIFGAGEVMRFAPPGFSLVSIGRQPDKRFALKRTHTHFATHSSATAAPVTYSPPPVAPSRAPGDPASGDLIERALERIDSGHGEEAITLCALALQRDPLSPKAHLVSGIAFHLSDDPRSAVHSLRSAVLLDPDEWVASFYLALSYEKLGQEEHARRAYTHVQRAAHSPDQRRSRLPILEAYRDQISRLSQARSRGPFGR